MHPRWSALSFVLALALAGAAVLEARAGTLAFEPATASFGNVSVSAPPASRTVTITNSGPATTISGFTKPGCAEFTVSASGLPVTLGNGESYTVTVSYDPVDRIADACTITVQDDNPATDTFGATGDGTAPVLMVSPASLSFADQPWSSGTGETMNVTLSNLGEEPISASNLQAVLTTGTNFSLGTVTGLPIGPGEDAFLPVTFDPASIGQKTDLLTLALNNDPPGAANPTVSLTGTGIAEPASAGPPPSEAGVHAAGPSPSRGTVTIAYSVPRPGPVAVEACDLTGRIVARIAATATRAGAHSETLRAGEAWSPAPGIYFVRVSFDGAVLGVRRVAVVR